MVLLPVISVADVDVVAWVTWCIQKLLPWYCRVRFRDCLSLFLLGSIAWSSDVKYFCSGMTSLFFNSILPHNAVLAWYMLSLCVCLFTCLCPSKLIFIKMTGEIELVFWHGGFLPSVEVLWLDVHSLLHVSIDSNALTPLLWLGLDLLYNLFIQLCSSWWDFSQHSTLHDLSVETEFLVYIGAACLLSAGIWMT